MKTSVINQTTFRGSLVCLCKTGDRWDQVDNPGWHKGYCAFGLGIVIWPPQPFAGTDWWQQNGLATWQPFPHENSNMDAETNYHQLWAAWAKGANASFSPETSRSILAPTGSIRIHRIYVFWHPQAVQSPIDPSFAEGSGLSTAVFVFRSDTDLSLRFANFPSCVLY